MCLSGKFYAAAYDRQPQQDNEDNRADVQEQGVECSDVCICDAETRRRVLQHDVCIDDSCTGRCIGCE